MASKEPIDVFAVHPKKLNALIGCSAALFHWFYAKFCGGLRLNAVFVALWFLKTYPTDRGASLQVNGRAFAYHHAAVWETIKIVGARCEAWFFDPAGIVRQQLQIAANYVPALGRTVVGLIDVVPIYVGRMKGCSSVQYQPKYKRCVAKFQFVTNLLGTPVWWSGPHLGVRNDLEIFETHRPPLRDGEVLLADKGYQNDKEYPLLFPSRKNSGARKANRTAEEAKEEIISWYRSTIEHYFAQMKKFAIVFGLLRCRNAIDKPTEDRLRSIMHIITALKYKQIHDSPLKDLEGARSGDAAAAMACVEPERVAAAAAQAAAAGAGVDADAAVRWVEEQKRLAGFERRRVEPVLSESDHERFGGDGETDAESGPDADDESDGGAAAAAAAAAARKPSKAKRKAKSKGKSKGKRKRVAAGAKRKRVADDPDPAAFLQEHEYMAMQLSQITAAEEESKRAAAAAAAAAAAGAGAGAAAAAAAEPDPDFDPDAPASAAEPAALGERRHSARLAAAAKRRRLFQSP